MSGPTTPWIEPTLTMVPLPAAAMTSPNARHIAKIPVAFVRIEASHALSGASKVVTGRPTALLTSPSTFPKSASTRSR